jgi:hypothetical protein
MLSPPHVVVCVVTIYLSGGSHGNIEEEERADVPVCGIEGKQDFV